MTKSLFQVSDVKHIIFSKLIFIFKNFYNEEKLASAPLNQKTEYLSNI